jgi:hypothetical protein
MRNLSYLASIFSFLMIFPALLSTSQISSRQQSGQQFSRSGEYSDEELMSFISASRQVMPLQQESQLRMIREIEEENFSIERFNMILEAHTRGMEVETSDEEMESFNNVLESIQEVQIEYEEKIIGAIEREGLSVEQYQAIFSSYQQNTELQMRINALMEAMEADGEL